MVFSVGPADVLLVSLGSAVDAGVEVVSRHKMVNRGAEDGWLVAVVHGRKDAKSAPEAPPRLVRLAPYRSRVPSVLWSRCLRPGVMGDPFDSKEACVRVSVCVGVPTSNQELGKGCLSERVGDHKGDGIVSCFGLSQEPPSCDSPRPALDKSCPDYLRPYLHSILLSSFCKPPKPPNSPITWLSVSHHPSPSYRRASTHTEKRGTLPKLQLVCVCAWESPTKNRQLPRLAASSSSSST